MFHKSNSFFRLLKVLSLSIILIVIAPNVLFAHDDTADTTRKVVYLDSTSRSIRIKPSTYNVDISYKHQLSSTRAILFGVGVRGYYTQYYEEDIYEDSEKNTEDKYHSKSLTFALNSQFFIFKQVESNLYLYWGPGINFSFNPSINGSSFWFRGERYSFGLDGTAGFEWYISKKLSFIGECIVYVSYSRDVSDWKSDYSRRRSIRERYTIGSTINQLGVAFYID